MGRGARTGNTEMTSPTVQWFIQNEDTVSQCKSTVVTEMG